jgi:hypothetical protein
VLNTQALTAAMTRLGYTAAGVGEREIVAGFERLQKEMKQASFPFLGTNLVYQDSGEPAFSPSLVKVIELAPSQGKKRKVRLALLGLARMNAGVSQETPDHRRIVTSDPVAAARQAVPALRKKADLVVALVTLEPDQAKALVKEVPGIDLVLGSFGALQTLSSETPASGNPADAVRVVYAGNQGKKLGEIRIFLGAEGAPSRFEANLVSLGRIVPDDPDMMEIMQQNRIAINEIHRKEAPMVDSEKLRATFEGASYVRSETCKTCHEEAYQTWQESKHAQAFKILVDRHQDYNPDCVGCHTTGFHRPTGFLNAKSSPDLENVQCEACHGPGKGHPDSVGKGFGPAGLSTCQTCHTTDNSPDFDPTAYMLKIRHWKTGQASAAPAAAGP